jgi:hypothetical protein
MDDAMAVSCLECVDDVEGDAKSVGQEQWPFRQTRSECFSFENSSTR